MFNSNYHPISLGRVVANKERDSFLVKIHPFEIIPHAPEELDDSTVDRKKEGIDHVGKKYSVTVVEQSWLEAEWIGKTYFEKAPDVAKGELVMVYRSGDSDSFYWDVFGRNDSHRKQEDVVISFSAKKDYDPGEPVPKDETNSYRFRINTYDKFVEFTTSEDNGEVTTYKMRFDMAEGTFELVDKETNRFYLNTLEYFLEMYNKDESYVRLDKKEIFINSQDLVQIDTTDVIVKCENLTVNSTNTEMNADQANLNFSNCDVGPGTWNFGATVNFNKPVTTNSTLTANGSFEADGDFEAKGNIKFAKPIKTTDGASSVGN